MKSVSLHCAALVLGLLSAAFARAEFLPADVAADARWVVHVDFNALRRGALGAHVTTAAGQMQAHMSSTGFAVNVPKVLETLGSATAYGTQFAKDPAALDGTLLLRGTPDLKKILESVILQATLMHPELAAELKDLPFPAYSIQDPKKPAAAVAVAFPPEPVIVVSKSRAQLLKARDVANGRVPSLSAEADSSLRGLLRPPANATVFIASTVPPDEFLFGDAPQARILKMASSFSVALGEDGPNTFAHATLVAASDEMGEKLMKIVEGMTAFASLMESNDRQLAEFLNSANVSRDNRVVTLRLAYPTERLTQMFANLQRRQQAPQATRQWPSPDAGRVVEQWTAEPQGDEPSKAETRVIENVELKNGATLTLGRRLNGGRAVRFTRVEIVSAQGGTPLIYGPQTVNFGADMAQIRFPGVDGTYTLKVDYVNDGAGKAKYAIIVRDPRPVTPPAQTKQP